MRIFSVSLLLLFSLSLGCKSKKPVAEAEVATEAEPLPGASVALQMLSAGSYCGIDAAGQHLITSQTDWEKLWKEFSANRMPAPPPMEVDFDEHAVVAVFMGTQTSGGHEVVIQKARIDGATLFLEGYHQHPGRYCITTSAITQPYAMALVPAQELNQLEADFFSSTKDCER